MSGPIKQYCGDERMAEILRDIDAPYSLLEIYGLFHGCVAAPVMVPPSRYIHMILGEDVLDNEIHASCALNNIMALWNRIAEWSPRTDPFMVPALNYPATLKGLKLRVAARYSFTEHFIKGLDLGGARESDFSVDAIDAMETLAETQGFLQNYSDLLQKGRASKKDLNDSNKILGSMEEVINDCVARINVGLKSARMRSIEDMRRSFEHFNETPQAVHPEHSRKIGRNEPCPCKSGKKYKKCCGFLH